ncbi:hypothetical protein BIU82_04115 [Arthrobacter sp. SW1]|nr:hypothetical protein BIU82_04115 [Arthrobacter sp. SW1]
MQMAPRGRSRGTHLGDHLAHTDRLAPLHANALQMVVGGNQAVPVINLHAIPAAPKMPAHGTYHAGVGGIDPGAARSGEVLSPMELAGAAAERIHPQTEGRTGNKVFQGGIQLPLGRTCQLLGSDNMCFAGSRRLRLGLGGSFALGQGLDGGALKRHDVSGAGIHPDGEGSGLVVEEPRCNDTAGRGGVNTFNRGGQALGADHQCRQASQDARGHEPTECIGTGQAKKYGRPTVLTQ